LYDVLTAVEKIGQITDLKIENTTDVPNEICYSNITLEVEKLCYKFQDSNNFVLNTINFKLEPSEKIIIKGNNGSGKTTLIRILSGLLQPTSGTFFINDDTYRKINLDQYRSQISVIISGETPFEGTILENITFNNPNISQEDLKWAIDSVQLGEYIKSLPKGLDTKIYPEGKQLSSSNAQKILLARSIITKPKILFLEEPFDKMDDITANELIDFITDSNQKWALVITSKNPYWEKKCTRIIIMQEGEIYNDLKK
ncbi:MAG TPA: ATP-binding cassette domain-containing protein, partial [Flavobacterium sp.]|nr:ATP-binding cassette domain-containing protein [Flavobacterium sp.]